MSKKSKWMPTSHAMTELHYLSNDGCMAFMRRNGLMPVKRGRYLLWDRAAVERLVASPETGQRCMT